MLVLVFSLVGFGQYDDVDLINPVMGKLFLFFIIRRLLYGFFGFANFWIIFVLLPAYFVNGFCYVFREAESFCLAIIIWKFLFS